jgi:Predicted integral membrane protein
MKTQLQEKLRLGDFEIEPEKRRLTRTGGETVRLANKPFQVLLYLIENRARVVLRAELLERFWDGHDVYEEALSKCVGTIRKALSDQLDSPRFIETRWAEGYRYIGPLETEASQPELAIQEVKQPVAVKVLGAEETHSATPSTETQTQTPAPSLISSEKAKRTQRRLILVCSCLALTVGALFFYWQYQARTKASSTPARSVAVLPLANLTGDAEQDYFVDGITESLLTKLYQIKDLKVISAGQSRTFKNKETDTKVLGQQLEVEAILLGSVRFSGELVRVDVRLVNARDGSVMWSEGYEQFMRDIFALQDDIARRVVTELRGRLSQTDEQTLARRNTENGQAYELYAKGRFFWNKRTEEGLQKSIELFEQAINLDPNYAQAYAGLAQAYSLLNVYSATQTKDAFPKARAAAEKALALDESLVEAHTALALIREQYEWDWPGAEREFKRAIELNPNYATAHQWYSEYLTFLGRTEESLAQIRLAHKLELNSLIINAGLGFPLLHARKVRRSVRTFPQGA